MGIDPSPTPLSLSQCSEVGLLELRDSISLWPLHMWRHGSAVDNCRSPSWQGLLIWNVFLWNLPALAFFSCCCNKRSLTEQQKGERGHSGSWFVVLGKSVSRSLRQLDTSHPQSRSKEGWIHAADQCPEPFLYLYSAGFPPETVPLTVGRSSHFEERK